MASIAAARNLWEAQSKQRNERTPLSIPFSSSTHTTKAAERTIEGEGTGAAVGQVAVAEAGPAVGEAALEEGGRRRKFASTARRYWIVFRVKLAAGCMKSQRSSLSHRFTAASPRNSAPNTSSGTHPIRRVRPLATTGSSSKRNAKT